MHQRKFIVVVAFLVLLFNANSVKATRGEDLCVDYYGTGENFDLGSLEGDRYAVYFWPPNQRTRDECAVVHFKKLLADDVETVNSELESLSIPSNETVIEAKYVNSVGKQVRLLYYGDAEVKRQYRFGKRVSKYILRRVSDEYVLGINCSAGGRGMLLARALPTAAQLRAVVDTLEAMADTEGKTDCTLN